MRLREPLLGMWPGVRTALRFVWGSPYRRASDRSSEGDNMPTQIIDDVALATEQMREAARYAGKTARMITASATQQEHAPELVTPDTFDADMRQLLRRLQ